MNLFYSWQSDLPNKNNRSFIEKSLKNSIKKINKEITINPCIDRDTKNIPGSPDISSTIFDKIKKCDIFIVDITTINSTVLNKILRKRLTPNPNVLIELGYAIRQLGWKRIICVMNIKYSNIKELPFDIRQHRILTYNSNKKDENNLLSNILKSRIKEIINDPDNCKTEEELDFEMRHDINLFTEIDSKIPEKQIMYILEWIDTHKIYYGKKIENLISLIDEYKLESKQFLDSNIKKSANNFIESIKNYYNFLVMNFFVSSNDLDRFEINFYKDSDWKPKPEFWELSKKLNEFTNELIEKYKIYRNEIKVKLKI